MTQLESKLTPYFRRVRMLKTVQGLFFGLLAGGVLALVWVALDFGRVLYADWKGLGLLVGICAVLGAVAGFFRKTPVQDLARSMDARAGLQDRLGTATEERAAPSPFDDLVEQDAGASLTGLSPAKVFPVRFGKMHAAAFATLVIAAAAFLLGNSPLVRGPKTATERKELQKLGEAVKRVAKPLEKSVNATPIPEGQKKLANELNKFARELEEGKINKEEALRKANDMAKQAEDHAKEKGEEAQKAADQAETALSKYTKAQLEDQGASQENFDRLKLSPEEQKALDQALQEQGFQNPPSKFTDKQLSEMGIDRNTEKLAQMTAEQREQLRNSIAQKQQELQKEIDRIEKMPEAERKAMEKQLQEMREQQEALRKLMEGLKLSEEALKTFRELMQSPEMKELREMMQKMQQNAKQLSEQGKLPTREELEQQLKNLEELAKNLKDPEFRQQYLDALREAIKQMKEGQMSQEAMQQMLGALGAGLGLNPDGSPAATQDDNFADTGKVNKSDKEMETKGKTQSTSVRGQWKDDQGEQWSVTVKAPTQVGNRSTVPYQNVLPQYRHSVEKALSGGKIPKGQEKRVKEYFDSLAGGKSK